jgi:hypothetical protein
MKAREMLFENLFHSIGDGQISKDINFEALAAVTDGIIF